RLLAVANTPLTALCSDDVRNGTNARVAPLAISTAHYDGRRGALGRRVSLVLRARRHPALTSAVGLVVCLWAILTIDHFASRESQLLLGGATVLLLVALSTRLSAELRAQLAIVVAMATCFEVLGSIIWGVYRYRL